MKADASLTLILFLSVYSPDHIVIQTIFGRPIKSFTDSHEAPEGSASFVVSRSLICLRAVPLVKYLDLLDSFCGFHIVFGEDRYNSLQEFSFSINEIGVVH